MFLKSILCLSFVSFWFHSSAHATESFKIEDIDLKDPTCVAKITLEYGQLKPRYPEGFPDSSKVSVEGKVTIQDENGAMTMACILRGIQELHAKHHFDEQVKFQNWPVLRSLFHKASVKIMQYYKDNQKSIFENIKQELDKFSQPSQYRKRLLNACLDEADETALKQQALEKKLFKEEISEFVEESFIYFQDQPISPDQLFNRLGSYYQKLLYHVRYCASSQGRHSLSQLGFLDYRLDGIRKQSWLHDRPVEIIDYNTPFFIQFLFRFLDLSTVLTTRPRQHAVVGTAPQVAYPSNQEPSTAASFTPSSNTSSRPISTAAAAVAVAPSPPPFQVNPFHSSFDPSSSIVDLRAGVISRDHDTPVSKASPPQANTAPNSSKGPASLSSSRTKSTVIIQPPSNMDQISVLELATGQPTEVLKRVLEESKYDLDTALERLMAM